jgi:hypothetical protein
MSSSENTQNSINMIYIVPIVLLVIGILIFFYIKKKNSNNISSTSSTSSNSNNENDIKKQKLYKENIIKSINEYNGIKSKENFYNFNNIIVSPDSPVNPYEGFDCLSTVAGNGKINDTKDVSCSTVFNPFFEGNFSLKCNLDKKWEVIDYNCKTKGLTDKKDLTGKWKILPLTQEEQNGSVPINYDRELSEEEKNNPRNYIIFKNFNMDTEKGVSYVDGKDLDYEYIKNIGYTFGNLFPVGMTFVDNNYDKIVGSKFYIKKI